MNRYDYTSYKLDLTQDEFYELCSMLYSESHDRQLNSHLIEIFKEAERKANNPYLLQARRLVDSFYLGLQQISQRASDIFNPAVSCQQPIVRLAVTQDVLRNEEASAYLADNIPSGLVDWYIIPSPFDSYSDSKSRQIYVDFRGTPSSMNIELKIEEPEKRGFFEE